MSRDPWNPAQYERFRDERSRPFFDLAALVQPREGMHVVDLGCGTGELTRQLHERLKALDTRGVDNSPAMLERCVVHAGGGLRFEAGDISTWAPKSPVDLLFSNAALHWVPDHEALFARLKASIRNGGQIAVQMPANHDHASHTAAREVAAEAPFAEALQGFVRPMNVQPPEAYAVLFHRLGFKEQHVQLRVYPHLLASREEVVEWVKGSTLTAYERMLPAPLMAKFLVRYRERLFDLLPDERPFFFTFKRLFLWAQR